MSDEQKKPAPEVAPAESDSEAPPSTHAPENFTLLGAPVFQGMTDGLDGDEPKE
ncbi:hypothetical protein ACFV94_36210 [Streptomyces sp. NPDC059896]|uniref:hypothetical protein n=1 Tax=unclassified Streptomyces TaxID=2593676 RepID=UPI003649B0A3